MSTVSHTCAQPDAKLRSEYEVITYVNAGHNKNGNLKIIQTVAKGVIKVLVI